MSTIASKIPFTDLCRLCEKISTCQRNKRGECLQRYITYFRDFAKKEKDANPNVDDSFYPVMRLLLPYLDRERGAYGVKENTLAKIYIRILGLAKDGPDAMKLLNFRAPKAVGGQAGDFADVSYWVLKHRCPEGGSLTVEQVNNHLTNIAEKHAAHDPRGVDDELVAMFCAMSANEQKWLIRMLLKHMNIGLGQTRIFNTYHPDAQELYDVTNSLEKVCQSLRDPSVRLHEVDVSVFSPFRPMLAERCDVKHVEDSMKKGHIYYTETKHDGERFQLHMKDGIYKYFSRRGFDFTESFGSSALSGILTPHIARLLRPDVQSCIIDGEMMGWNTKLKCFKMKGINFDVKSLNFGDVIQPCFCVFDILHLNGEVLTNKPLRERLEILSGLFTEEKGTLMYTERKQITTAVQVTDELNLAIDCRLEGIVLKDPASVYKPNTRKGGWYKIKPEYTEGVMDHLDLIIMGGYYGDGRRRGIISHFLVGVAVPPNEGAEPSEFHSLVRVGSGYTMDELSELLQKLSPYWQQVRVGESPPGLVWTKEKPDVWIPPNNSFLLEVKATEIVFSKDFKMDYTLRFPRVEQIRYDKKWSECLTITEFENLRKEASGKLYSRHVTTGGVEDSPKKRKIAQAPATLGEQFRGADISAVCQKSMLLNGKEFCVVTGWLELKKQDIEKKIVEYGGTVVQNPGSNTFCALAGETSLRVRNMSKVGQFDVARLDWFLNALENNDGTLPSWSPSDLICTSPQTAEFLSKKFDKYGDSYTVPCTVESLKYCFQQVEKSGDLKEMSEEEMADMDILLFSGPSPFGFFRLCYAYFDKYKKLNDVSSEEMTDLDICELNFRFYGGQVTPVIEEWTTHVVVHSKCENHITELQDINRHRATKFYVVMESWIEESVKSRRREKENS